MIEKTLVVLKPDTIKRAIVGEIITRFEKVGLHLMAMKMIQVDEKLAHDHYEGIGTMITRYSNDIYRVNADFMMSGPVVAMVFEGIEAISLVRKMMGATNPKDAMPGTIRGDYSHISREYVNANKAWLPNIAHASADATEAEKEIALWFKDSEIYTHEQEGTLYKRGHK